MEALIPVQVAEVKQRQLRLGSEQQALLLMQFNAGQGAQVLVFEEQHAGFAQPLVFGGADAIEKTQVMAHPLPHVVGNRVLCQGALATPGAQGPHRVSAIRLWSSNRQGGYAPCQ
ncbi:hypothetical protein D9M73_210320 [compost metagenome]